MGLYAGVLTHCPPDSLVVRTTRTYNCDPVNMANRSTSREFVIWATSVLDQRVGRDPIGARSGPSLPRPEVHAQLSCPRRGSSRRIADRRRVRPGARQAHSTSKRWTCSGVGSARGHPLWGADREVIGARTGTLGVGHRAAGDLRWWGPSMGRRAGVTPGRCRPASSGRRRVRGRGRAVVVLLRVTRLRVRWLGRRRRRRCWRGARRRTIPDLVRWRPG